MHSHVLADAAARVCFGKTVRFGISDLGSSTPTEVSQNPKSQIPNPTSDALPAVSEVRRPGRSVGGSMHSGSRTRMLLSCLSFVNDADLLFDGISKRVYDLSEFARFVQTVLAVIRGRE